MKTIFAFALLFASVAHAEDIVFSGVHLKKDHGAYFQIDRAHLYRVHTDGSGLRQLTFGDEDDVNPSFDRAKNRILFWRHDKDDLIAGAWSCSIRADGNDLKRETRSQDMMLGGTASKSAKLRDKLPGIPSHEGGISVPIDIGTLQDGTFVFGYFDYDPSLLGIANSKGKPIRRFHVYRMKSGKKTPCELFGDEQWRDNPQGLIAFWWGQEKQQILLQKVERNETGGEPTIYRLSATTGQVDFTVSSYFLEDVSDGRTSFLATTWDWGTHPGSEGAIAFSRLTFWSGKTPKPNPLCPDLSCGGACFVPSGANRK